MRYVFNLSLVFFFFSSRRRHTRSKRDWSSDVCSSDLAVTTVLRPIVEGLRDGGTPYRGCLYAGLMVGSAGIQALEFNARFGDRSEERRVGKECRARWSAEEEKKKSGGYRGTREME